jgi:hypothetical protein
MLMVNIISNLLFKYENNMLKKTIIYSVIYCLLNPLIFLLFYKIFSHWLEVSYYWMVFNILFPIIPIFLFIFLTLKSKDKNKKFKEYLYSLIYLVILYIVIIFFLLMDLK